MGQFQAWSTSITIACTCVENARSLDRKIVSICVEGKLHVCYISTVILITSSSSSPLVSCSVGEMAAARGPRMLTSQPRLVEWVELMWEKLNAGKKAICLALLQPLGGLGEALLPSRGICSVMITLMLRG